MTTHADQPGGLSSDDQRLLDALVDGGFDIDALEALSPPDRRRARVIVDLFELLEDYPVEDADDTLVHATLARVDRAEDERAARMAFDGDLDAERGPRRRFRMPDFVSVAAMLLIGASVAWPVISYVRQRSIDNGCAGNMRQLAWAFNQYANDYDNAIPIAQAGLLSSWSPMHRNVVNLKPLIENGYCDLAHLDCPGHDGMHGESYSYQWQVPGHQVRWGVGPQVLLVLGDRNPIVDAFRTGRHIPPMSASINHGGRGQWVLGTDGTTTWLVQPVVRGDNIWLPGPLTVLHGDDPVENPTDAFLTH